MATPSLNHTLLLTTLGQNIDAWFQDRLLPNTDTRAEASHTEEALQASITYNCECSFSTPMEITIETEDGTLSTLSSHGLSIENTVSATALPLLRSYTHSPSIASSPSSGLQSEANNTFEYAVPSTAYNSDSELEQEIQFLSANNAPPQEDTSLSILTAEEPGIPPTPQLHVQSTRRISTLAQEVLDAIRDFTEDNMLGSPFNPSFKFSLILTVQQGTENLYEENWDLHCTGVKA
jgi:hypothetical protein